MGAGVGGRAMKGGYEIGEGVKKRCGKLGTEISHDRRKSPIDNAEEDGVKVRSGD